MMEAHRGTVPRPLEPHESQLAAIQIVDDWGIERLRIMGMKE